MLRETVRRDSADIWDAEHLDALGEQLFLYRSTDFRGLVGTPSSVIARSDAFLRNITHDRHYEHIRDASPENRSANSIALDLVEL